jgi:hypothetical protein
MGVPTFYEFLLAPWKFFVYLATPKISAPGMPVTAFRPDQVSLCSMQDIGGQTLHVCRFGGYEMPAFVFFASILIFLVFVAASVALLRQCFQVADALNEVDQKLARLPGAKAGAAMSQTELTTIRNLMHKSAFTRHAWAQFEETLLPMPGSDQVYSTSPIESQLSKAVLIEENVHTALFNAIPGVLTGLGLLMTFVAILDGLSHVSVAANMDVQGIGGLINGLSGKFVSSIVAVTCAVSFVFIERIAYSRPYAAYRRLLNHLGGRFRRRTTEHLLLSIESYLHRQYEMQREVSAPQGRR